MDLIYLAVRMRMGWRSSVRIHRMASTDAAELFMDETFDFVYIDADHTYDAVKADLSAWWPKVRPGGVLAGDDYGFAGWWEDGVTRAVSESLQPVEIRDRQWVMRKST